MNYQSKSAEAINSILTNIYSNKYKTESDLTKDIQIKYNEVFNGITNYNINIPEIKSGDLPIVETILDSFYSVSSNLVDIWNKLKDLGEQSKDQFNNINSNLIELNTLINSVQNKLTEFQLYSSDSSDNFLWASDSFLNKSNIDLTKTTAFIDNKLGMAMLKASSLVSLNSSIKSVTIDKLNSVGVPGNNFVINKISGAKSIDDKNPEPQVVLESGINNLSSISNMFDSQPNSWFEWEVNNIPVTQKCKTQGASYVQDISGTSINILDSTSNFGWKKFIQWPGENTLDRGKDGTGYYLINTSTDKNAKIVLNIELNTPTKISCLEIIPQVIGGVYCIVKDITVFNSDKSNSKKIVEPSNPVYLTEKLNESIKHSTNNIPENNYSGTGLWTIDETEISSLQITLEANGNYIPPLGFGHEYYFQLINKTETTSFALIKFVGHSEYIQRQPNPEQAIQASSSGGNLSGIGTLVGTAVAGVGAGLIGQTVGALLNQSTDVNIMRQGSAFDIFNGNRSVVAIKDIELSLRTYVEQNVIYSTPYYFPKELKAVSIISTESIPESWQGDFIKYELSVDGFNWTEINPENKSTVNTAFFAKGSRSILVKITLSRPKDINKDTPMLMNYTLKGISE